jgi:pyroglutamyl-peptidase
LSILLTGFENFLSHPYNPTQKLVEELAPTALRGLTVHREILPVTFAQANEAIAALIIKHRPMIHLSLGLAASRSTITPEVLAINCAHNPKRPDNDGKTQSLTPLLPEGADLYWSNLPLQRIEQELALELSFTAGTYVCNSVMYWALHTIKQENLDTLSGFIHIPPDRDFSSSSHDHPTLEELSEVIRRILEISAEAL